jgi:uncharacterized protein YjbJ (UPF0337 family)
VARFAAHRPALAPATRSPACRLTFPPAIQFANNLNRSSIMADDLTSDGLENQVKGAAKQVEGKARNAVGGITGDTSEQLKGKAKDLEGKGQRKLGEKEVDADN